GRNAGSGTLQGTTNITAAAGLVTFTDLAHNLATNITINFTSTGLTGATSSLIAISPGAFTKLQLLVPGETAAPGSATGKTGTPSAQLSYIPFNLTVNAVDANWNLVNTVTHTVGISSSDSGAILPANAALVAG